MIKVKSITITEFRGIRNLTLQIGARNLPFVEPMAQEKVA